MAERRDIAIGIKLSQLYLIYTFLINCSLSINKLPNFPQEAIRKTSKAKMLHSAIYKLYSRQVDPTNISLSLLEMIIIITYFE